MAKSNRNTNRAGARSTDATRRSSRRTTTGKSAKPGKGPKSGRNEKPGKRAKPDDPPKASKPAKSGKAARGSQPESHPEPLSAKAYDRELRKLHVELVKLQQWVVHKGLKVCIVFEGRDGAGKGGTIKAITERVSPRVFRVIALPAPSSRERSQMYAQRYIPHLPAAGEIVIFDRSWYNRAGVERVMGFCTEDQARGFLKVVPAFERLMIDSGIILLKYWLEVSPEEQTRRLQSRIEDGRKIWKLSPMDVQSYDKWDEYTRVRDEMFVATDTSASPWFVARSESKRGVRLNIIKHLLSRVPYESVPSEKVKLPKRKVGKYKEPSPPFKYIPEPY